MGTCKIPYGMKILYGIKFYGFMVAGRAVKLKSGSFLYQKFRQIVKFNTIKFSCHTVVIFVKILPFL